MKLKRFVWLAALPLLCPGWARADVVTSPFFNIQLSDWVTGQTFSVTGSSTPTSTDGFTQNSFCPGDSEECFFADPGTRLNGGGDAIPFNSNVGATITFTTNPTTVDYENVGPNLETVILTTTISGDQLDQLYTCESDVFSFCGFAIVDPPQTEELKILFTDGNIPSAVPEPRQYILLLTALGACVALDRLRRRRARA